MSHLHIFRRAEEHVNERPAVGGVVGMRAGPAPLQHVRWTTRVILLSTVTSSKLQLKANAHTTQANIFTRLVTPSRFYERFFGFTNHNKKFLTKTQIMKKLAAMLIS